MVACRTHASPIRARVLALLVSCLLTLALGPALARGGTYVDYSCHTPSDHVAAADGWSAELRQTSTAIEQSVPDIGSDQCANAGQVAFGLGSTRSAQGDRASLIFTAPSGESVADFRASVCGDPKSTGTGVSLTWTGPDYSSPGGFHAQYGSELGCTGTSSLTYLDATDLSSPQVYFSVTCLATGCTPDGIQPVCITGPCNFGTTGSVSVVSFVATLRDDSPPVVSGASGALLASGQHTGSESVTYSATDAGGGLYRTVAQVKPLGLGNWETIAVAPVDTNGGKCVDAGEDPTNDYEFDALVPCKLSVQSASISIDTSQLPPGDDVLRVYVEDAAGNRTDVIGPRTFTVASAGGAISSAAPAPIAQLAANNGAHASRTAFVHVHGGTTRRVRYGHALPLTGQLVDAAGQVIAGAQLELVARSLSANGDGVAAWRPLGEIVTDRHGFFRARVPAGANRSIAVVYRANLNDPGWTSAAEVNVFVSAGVTLRVVHSHVRNHHSVIFRGRVAGKVPPGGLLVTIQVQYGSGWILVTTTHPIIQTDSHGRFTAAYRFERTPYNATFRFRALANRDSAFDYEIGRSNAVVVHVRP